MSKYRPADKDERKAQVAEIIGAWRNGSSIDEIVEITGVPKRRVENVISFRISATLGMLQHSRIRAFCTDQGLRILQAIGEKVDNGDTEAGRLALQVIERLAKLGGADAAQRSVHGLKRVDDMTEEELMAFLGRSGPDG